MLQKSHEIKIYHKQVIHGIQFFCVEDANSRTDTWTGHMSKIPITVNDPLPENFANDGNKVSIPCHSLPFTPFHSIPFIPFHAIPLCSIVLYSILFCSIPFYNLNIWYLGVSSPLRRLTCNDTHRSRSAAWLVQAQAGWQVHSLMSAVQLFRGCPLGLLPFKFPSNTVA